MLIEAHRSILLIVDFQERLMPAIHAGAAVAERAGILIRSADALAIPVAVTEQYPRGLGPTIAPIRELLPATAFIHEKITFSAQRDPAFAAHFAALREVGRDQIVVAGAEAHVCVLQTALDLQAAGYQIFLVADAVGSRVPESRECAIDRARQAGCVVVNSEMVVFEWMERAGTETFRALSQLIR
ncbi:MAG: amidase [Saliniramus fredricksonii]|uniref:Amidase n=1 Tax=Saliniramus fredricksonii TaxID=1653334 RepID=A0A0P7XNP2_9HYPH|nr:hydrolase [Saliniramus fredricksonii]KPQ09093.1 MAG: amidase [Saliniramus fredricksonii]SCC81640.1 Nicotinamidase-related amidase [Saliniramus fredricksonii]